MKHTATLVAIARLAFLALGLALASATVVFAHASLNGSEPADGAVVAEPPARFVLTFSEPVAPLVIRLVRPDGSQTDLGDLELKDRALSIGAPDGLSTGTHLLSWRVVSADGHPIGGSVVFSIGEASAEAPLVDEKVDWLVRASVLVSRTALYVGLLIGVGGAFARLHFLSDIAAGRRVVDGALSIGVAGALLSGGFQGLDALDVPISGYFDRFVWSTGLDTTFGRTIAASLGALLLAITAQRLAGRAARVVAGLALVAGGIAPVLSGHASSAQPEWLMRSAVFVHVTAAMIWIGALAPLAVALGAGGTEARSGLLRFSRVIPYVLIALLGAGTALTVVQVADPQALAETNYGLILLFKFALVGVMLALAVLNRWVLTEGVVNGNRPDTDRLVRSILLESLVALTIIAVVSGWRFTPPPRVIIAAASEPATEYIHTDKALAYIWVLPGRVGKVNVSVNVLTGDFLQLDAREVSIVLSNPNAGVEPFKRELVRHGEANWRADGLTIPLAGLWRVRVDVLITDFEIARLEGQIRIRP